MLLTRSPLIHPASWASAFDLHVLSTPPAFVLSQDQTLRTKTKTLKPRKTNQTKTVRSAIPTKNTQKQKTGIKKQTNTLSSSQTTPTRSSTHECLACFRKAFRAMFPRPELLASFAAVRRNKENNTHFPEHRQIMQLHVASQSFFARLRHFFDFRAAQPAQNRRFSCPRPQSFSQNVPQQTQYLRVSRPQYPHSTPIRHSHGRNHHVF